jgi:hypothetical protein
MATKTWEQKFLGMKPSHVAVVSRKMLGIDPGQLLLIPDAPLIDGYVRSIPPGEQRTVAQLKAELAAAHGADGTCPLVVGISLRIISERAYERLLAGESDVSPFWRVLGAKDSVSKKLSFGTEALDALRARFG